MTLLPLEKGVFLILGRFCFVCLFNMWLRTESSRFWLIGNGIVLAAGGISHALGYTAVFHCHVDVEIGVSSWGLVWASNEVVITLPSRGAPESFPSVRLPTSPMYQGLPVCQVLETGVVNGTDTTLGFTMPSWGWLFLQVCIEHPVDTIILSFMGTMRRTQVNQTRVAISLKKLLRKYTCKNIR